MTTEKPTAPQLAARLAARRKALNISQAEAASRSAVTLRTWQRWESGDTRPHYGHLPKMATALETTAEELLGVAGTHDVPQSLNDQALEARLARIERVLSQVYTTTQALLAVQLDRPGAPPLDARELLRRADQLREQELPAPVIPPAEDR